MKAQMLERMKRIVMDKNADGSLVRQNMASCLQCLFQQIRVCAVSMLHANVPSLVMQR
jgi:hypothetical protein